MIVEERESLFDYLRFNHLIEKIYAYTVATLLMDIPLSVRTTSLKGFLL